MDNLRERGEEERKREGGKEKERGGGGGEKEREGEREREEERGSLYIIATGSVCTFSTAVVFGMYLMFTCGSCY